MALDQLLVKVAHIKTSVTLAIERLHFKHLIHWRAPRRDLAQPLIDEPLQPVLFVAPAPAPKRSHIHAQNPCRFFLAQAPLLLTLIQLFETHHSHLLQHSYPLHLGPLSRAYPEPDNSCATATGQMMCYLQSSVQVP